MGAVEPPYILVVDDSAAVRECLSVILTALGYLAVCTPSPTEALALFHARRPRAVITDNAVDATRADVLSDASGLQLAECIKAASPGTPVIMLSALPPARAAALCDAVLVKPVPLHTLAGTLRRLNVSPDPAPGQISWMSA